MKKRDNYYKWELVILLWLAFFLNQGDRQIYNVVIPLIKADLGFSDVQLGLVATVFTLFYGVLVPFAGYAGDVLRRKWIVFFSLLIFSLGTLFTGISNSVFMLILFRSITTGGGEAFYYPAANSLLGQFHHKTRAMAMSIHQTALYIGIVASGFLAGFIGENFGWRSAFYVFGAAGILWAVVVGFRMKDTPLNNTSKDPVQRIPMRLLVQKIFKKRTVWMLCIAFGTMVFVNMGYLTWMPTYLHENFSLSLTNAGFSSMFYHHLFAFFGVLIGGKLSDKWAIKHKKVRIITEYTGLFLGAPFIFLMGFSESLILCYTGLAIFGFFRGVYDSNLFAALFDVIEPKYRASSVGVMLAFAFIVGSLAPVLLGWVKSLYGLSFGISFLSLFYIIGGVMIFIASKYFFDKDFIVEKIND